LAEFSTPTVQSLAAYPTASGAFPLDTLIFVAFDQIIDKEEIVKSVTLAVQKGKVYSGAKLAKASEIENNVSVKQLTTQYPEGHWIALAPSKTLPKNSSVTVKVPMVKYLQVTLLTITGL
jgi:hypothetical protein